jgi:hypothetical protein
MHLPTMSTAGLTELMMPLNRTALNSLNSIHAVAGKMPAAIGSAAAKNINANVARYTREGQAMGGAWGGGDAASAARTAYGVRVPSGPHPWGPIGG